MGLPIIKIGFYKYCIQDNYNQIKTIIIIRLLGIRYSGK
jgi:hypothetical protein